MTRRIFNINCRGITREFRREIQGLSFEGSISTAGSMPRFLAVSRAKFIGNSDRRNCHWNSSKFFPTPASFQDLNFLTSTLYENLVSLLSIKYQGGGREGEEKEEFQRWRLGSKIFCNVRAEILNTWYPSRNIRKIPRWYSHDTVGKIQRIWLKNIMVARKRGGRRERGSATARLSIAHTARNPSTCYPQLTPRPGSNFAAREREREREREGSRCASRQYLRASPLSVPGGIAAKLKARSRSTSPLSRDDRR